MKWLAICILLTTVCCAQQQLRGAYGVEFGASKTAVQRIAKDGWWAPEITDNPKLLVYTVAKGTGVTRLEFRFDDDRLATITSLIREKECCHVMREYARLVNSLTLQHGRSSARRAFDGAVSWGDDRDVDEVKAGRAEISDEWQIASADPKVFSVVRTAITANGEISAKYQQRGLVIVTGPRMEYR
ncbi:MAG: hypothetical protein IPP94_05440 [Ignavibacteria bacterium]|nr:hypothetical protein [Ignavibacteria bacterium]